MVGNTAISGNILKAVVQALVERLPSGWRILETRTTARRASATSGTDAVLKFRGPRGNTGSVIVQAKRRLEPKDVDDLAAMPVTSEHLPVLVMAPFISARTQERLKAGGVLDSGLS